MTLSKRSITLAATGLLAFGVGGLGGCGGYKPKKFDISIQPRTTDTVLVDLIAVPKDDVETKWMGLDVENYFSGNNTVRASNVEFTKTYKFEGGATQQVQINRNDPIWSKWFKTRPVLIVLATSGSLAREAAKNPSVRKARIDMTTEYYDADAFTITVKDGGIQVDPPPMKKPS